MQVVLEASDHGGALVLRSKEGKDTLTAASAQDGGRITLAGASGATRATLEGTNAGGHIRLLPPAHGDKVELTSATDGAWQSRAQWSTLFVRNTARASFWRT